MSAMLSLVLQIAAVIQPAAPASADACATYTAAMVKLSHTPYLRVTTIGAQTGGGHFAFPTKRIFTGNAVYDWKNDTWKKVITNADELEQAFRKAQLSYTRTCHFDGSETVSGEAADIISSHAESQSVLPEPVSHDDRLWISQKSGLPLKADEKLSVTDSPGQISSIAYSVVYTYENVQAPAM